jgi:lipopolysaccharide export system ATP-binding protein
MYKRAQNGVGYLAQDASVFTKLSVEDNIRLVLEMTSLTKHEQDQKLEKLISEFSIGHIRKNKAYALSGGERRRTEIARSLVTDPSFILLDEPFAGIDPIAVEDIQKIIEKLKSKGIGVLITDHNVRETLTITDRSYLLYNGEILKTGTTSELTNDDEAKKLYLGTKFKLDY